MIFTIDPRLENSSVTVAEWPLCRVLLKNDKRFPWLILVPKRAGIREIHQLNAGDRQQVLAEMCFAAEALERLYTPEKINVAALGNVVPQLHIHVVARYKEDAAWPGPIWGVGQEEAYQQEDLDKTIEKLKGELAACPQ